MRSPRQFSFSKCSTGHNRPMKRGWRSLAAVSVGLTIAACGSGSGTPVRVTIPQGATLRVAADSLSRAGVVAYPRFFRVYASMRRGDRAIKAGTYMLRPHEGWGTVLDALRRGKGLVHVVTIPEGFSISQIAPLLASKLGQPEDSVMAAMSDTALLHQLDVPTKTLEGYLFPDTYTFSDG